MKVLIRWLLVTIVVFMIGCSLPLIRGKGSYYKDIQKELKREFALADTKFYQSTISDPEVISQLVAVEVRLQFHLKVISEFMEVIDYDNAEEVALLDILMSDASKLKLLFVFMLNEAIEREQNKLEEDVTEDPNAEPVPENNIWHPYRPYIERFEVRK